MRVVEFDWRYFLATAIPCVAYCLRALWQWIADPAGTIETICGPGACLLPMAFLMDVFGPMVAYPVLILGATLGAALARRAFTKFGGPRLIAWFLTWLAAGISSTLPLTALLVLGFVGDVVSGRVYSPHPLREIFSSLSFLAAGAIVGLICGSIYELIVRIEKSIDRWRKGPAFDHLPG